jgi:hypothetical protein
MGKFAAARLLESRVRILLGGIQVCHVNMCCAGREVSATSRSIVQRSFTEYLRVSHVCVSRMCEITCNNNLPHVQWDRQGRFRPKKKKREREREANLQIQPRRQVCKYWRVYVFMYGSYKHSGSFSCAQKIRALNWKPKIHFVCSQSYCFTYYKKHFKEFQVFLASCPCVRKFKQNITADAGFLGDKATVFSGMIQGTSRVFRSSTITRHFWSIYHMKSTSLLL